MFWAKSIYCTVLTASGGIMGEDKTTACLCSLMAALLIASPRAMALGLQIHRPPCKLIHLSAFSIAPFFPSRLFSSMQTCSDAARLNNRGPKQMDFPVHCPIFYPPLDCESIHDVGQAHERSGPWHDRESGVRLSIGGQLEEEASAACWLWVWRSKTKRSERWPRRTWAKPWKFKQIQGEKITLVVLHTSPADVLFFDRPYFEKKRWARDGTLHCQCGT